MKNKPVATSGHFRITTDGAQWIIERRYNDHNSNHNGKWFSRSFVRTTKHALQQRLHYHGANIETIHQLVCGLPDCFDDWKSSQPTTGPPSKRP